MMWHIGIGISITEKYQYRKSLVRVRDPHLETNWMLQKILNKKKTGTKKKGKFNRTKKLNKLKSLFKKTAAGVFKFKPKF